MRKIILIGLITFNFFACKNSEFLLKESKEINYNETITLNFNRSILIKSDTNLFKLKLFYNKNNLVIDEIDFSPYNSVLHIFYSNNNNEQIILWETEYELYWNVNAYFLSNNEIQKAGNFLISLSNKEEDFLKYSIRDIKINKNKEIIVFSFLKDVNIFNEDTNSYKSFKGKKINYTYNLLKKSYNYNKN